MTYPERWKDMTQELISRHNAETCSKCTHSIAMQGTSHAGFICNYAEEMGRCRFCKPTECQEKGFFKPKKKGRKKKVK